MPADIDVLIPAFNAAATLRESIESILRQQDVTLRVLVVDDGSSDETPVILKDLSASDSRIHILHQPNGGIVSALNRALAQATAPLIARHDSDDIADPQRLARQSEYLHQHQDCVAVSSFARHIAWNGAATGSTARFRPIEQANPFALPSWEPYLLHPFLLARRWAMNSVGGYRHVKHAEDTDLYWRLQDVGRLHVMPEVLGSYRLSPDSVSSKSIVNGRVLALFSQLAALSARRRAEKKADLTFTSDWTEQIAGVGGTTAMLEAASVRLDQAERSYLKAAFAAKLLELTSYRPYELETEDCALIREALHESRLPISKTNARDLARARAIAVSRLASAGRVRDALTLCSLRTAPEAALRWALGQAQSMRRPRRISAPTRRS